MQPCVKVCPFVGECYTVRCPICVIPNISWYDDGTALHKATLFKCCSIGHTFFVCSEEPWPGVSVDHFDDLGSDSEAHDFAEDPGAEYVEHDE